MTWAMVTIIAAGCGLAFAVDGRVTLRQIRRLLGSFIDGPPKQQKVPGAASEPEAVRAARDAFGGGR